MFGYADHELASKSGYDLIHPDDLSYFSAAHQECKEVISFRPMLVKYRLNWTAIFVDVLVIRQSWYCYCLYLSDKTDSFELTMFW